MRRMLTILAVGALAAAVIGSAAALSVNGGTIQAGEDNDLTCTDAVQVEGWGLETDDGSVHFVRISGLGDCLGNDLFARITGAGGSLLTTCSVQPIMHSEERCRFGSPQQARAIEDIHVFIEGPTGTADDGAPTNGV